VVADATRRLRRIADELREHAVGEDQQIAGQLFEIPGRGQTLGPVLHIDERTDQRTRGRVTFGRFYLGNHGAVHAGAIPLAFSELLYPLSVAGGRPRTRTAYVHVDYRSVTPVGEELQIEGWVEREEGRKRLLRGTLHAGDRLCAEVEALYLAVPDPPSA
jgi:hypothetical protein